MDPPTLLWDGGGFNLKKYIYMYATSLGGENIPSKNASK